MARQVPRNAIVHHSAITEPKDGSVLGFLQLLKERYLTALDPASGSNELRRHQLGSLLKSMTFAESFLERVDKDPRLLKAALQVAVVGPTQAGKSTLINWLTGLDLAQASPIAGFTVHPQGFYFPSDTNDESAIADYFHGYRRVAPENLDHATLDCYSLIPAEAPTPALKRMTIWDTPDFDSVQSDEYQDAVLKVAALADVVILVLSKDKYADQTVWDFMALIEPLAQPTLVVINKTDPESEALLRQSLLSKWKSFRADPPPELLAIPYRREQSSSDTQLIHEALLKHMVVLSQKVHRNQLAKARQMLLQRHWSSWVGPLDLEHRLITEWQQRVDAAVKGALDRYRRDYLDHPHHYETFQRALAELLRLLEIPGIGSALLAARRAVTWPIRQLARLGGRGQMSASGSSAEMLMLHQLAQHVLIELSEGLMLSSPEENACQPWHTQLNHVLSRKRSPILVGFDTASGVYIEGFQPEIEKTAHGLYDHLSEHPVMLNSLRATRVTTDAAALALALHTGGIGVQDFVIAPAMLSLTTLLAEGAIGHFMDRAQEQLKEAQFNAVSDLFQVAMTEVLYHLPEELDTGTRLGISPAALARASNQLARA